MANVICCKYIIIVYPIIVNYVQQYCHEGDRQPAPLYEEIFQTTMFSLSSYNSVVSLHYRLPVTCESAWRGEGSS